jgi:AcrR family transcriptional regulator
VSSSADTKEQIITVAERLFAERGFAGTTLRNVVSEAGVNLAAVSYHFGSKEELFRGLHVQ